MALTLAGPVAAQETTSPPREPAKSVLSIELNRVVANEAGCRLGFVTQNRIGSDLSKTAFEIVLFNPEGLIERMLVLDFGAMPEGRTKVREFNLPNAPCDSIARILVNDVSACEGEGVAEGACASALSASSRTDVAFGL
ncbi:hypothetical protein U0C82_11870 [Fulvimarina sp. 2208YS6-2-32]|uniref:Tat pathway signal protein n=2 Tax=Fulvimarina uroteuthidis TaxID=3098149 RepID=A0ABU5I6S0_9HYPH|nr:hypothetical protein [Fulvimarina sp. 2208YS6-2-32]